MALSDIPVSFIWGPGGSKLTPDQIAQLKAIEAKKSGGIDTSPVGHWTQGAARVADAIAGAFQRGSIDRAETENSTYNEGIIKSLLGGSAPAGTSAIPASGASAEIAATAPSQPIDMTGNEVYSQFIDTVKQGGVQNPYALAAIAATGQRESQFSPGNVNRTWSDPSESGQPGTAGGIMSWRGPRYDALAATGDLSPAGQAKFFLQENPQLIQALNNAGSVEEAQSLMNNAWKFAGYDQPGGEAANRLSAAQGFLPSFQGGGEVAAATPEAAIEAVSPTQGGSLADEVATFEQTPEYSSQFPGQQPAVAAQQPTAVQQVAQALPAAGQAQQAAPAVNEAIIRAITDPRATPQTRAIAQALMEQQMRQQQAAQEMQMKQADPMRQIQLQKGQLELDQMRNPGVDGVTVGNRIVDRRTGKIVYEAPEGSNATFRRASPEEAQQYGAAAGQFGPDGRFYAQNPPQGTSLQVDPATGAVTFNQGAGVKPLTEGQSKDTVFATRASNALPLLDKYEQSLLSLGDKLSEGIPLNLGNYAQSEEYQVARDAGRDFLATILRKDTGAAITENEEKIYGQMFLPQPGDKPAALQAKRQRRTLAVEAIKAGMPTAAIENMTKALDSGPSALESAQPDPIPEDVDPELWEYMTPEERSLWK